MKKLIATALSIGLMASAQGAAKDLSAEKTIRLANMTRVSEGVYVIEDRQHIMLVPNITIIVGRDAVLVVDTGLGTESAQRVLKAAKKLAGRRKLYLTVTHFHPEHGFGAQVFKGQATIIYNRAQRDEMLQKAPGYQSLFATRLGVAKAMRDVRLVAPDVVYEDAASIDLGGRVVKLNYYKPAHTLGDQVVSLPDQGVVIMGDLLETGSFPIMPWFPELADTDVDPLNWRDILRQVAATQPQIVIPGHGRIGSRADLDAAAQHIEQAREAVVSGCAAGKTLGDLQQEATPLLAAQHPDWQLKDWIAMEIQVNHARLCRPR